MKKLFRMEEKMFPLVNHVSTIHVLTPVGICTYRDREGREGKIERLPLTSI